ncbi:MFS transporter [Pseudomonas sp. ANT_H12B]|uniref:MFS transporter n=1 Tax=Pseudomonas sp. ANT_H12B TaxID=2597348 RepID=UPI0011EBE8A3|nr:MFS transporter [Pseudomonas sp. ANT_H12B]KAA0964247.1 MFS transporter [Pseudomonas sp. ANT_H12B]
MLWQLTLILWVGGLWLLHIGLLPVLIDEIAGMLDALMVVFAAACVIFQALVLVQAEGLASLWRDIRGQLLMMALYACAMFFAVRFGWPDAVRWQVFSYLILGFSGLVLVLQPVPGWSGRVREAHP